MFVLEPTPLMVGNHKKQGSYMLFVNNVVNHLTVNELHSPETKHLWGQFN